MINKIKLMTLFILLSFGVYSQTGLIPKYDAAGKQSGWGNADTLNKEILTGSSLPTTAATKIGNKYLYITATDTTELTAITPTLFQANVVRGSSTPSVKVVSGSQTIDYSNAVWVTETDRKIYENGKWNSIIDIDTLTNISDIQNYTGSKRFIEITDQYGKGKFRKIDNYTDAIKTLDFSLSNLSDSDQNDRFVTGTGLTSDLAGAYVFGVGIAKGTYISKVLSSTTVSINQPTGITTASLAVTLSKIDTFYRVKTVNNIIYERVNEYNDINIEFFGGKGDWSANTVNEVAYSSFQGTDNTVPFFRAIRYSCEGEGVFGRKIKLRKGRYGVSGTINITKDNTTIQGEGDASSEIVFTESNSAITTTYFNATSLKRIYSLFLRDLRFAGYNRAQNAIVAQGCNQSDFQNLHFFGFADYAVKLEDFSSSKIQKLSIAGYSTSTTAKGVKILNTSTLAFVSKEYYQLNIGDYYENSANVSSYDNRFETVKYGVFVENTHTGGNNIGNIIYSNSSFNSTGTDKRILKIDNQNASDVMRVIGIEFNHLRLNTTSLVYAIEVIGTFHASSNVILKVNNVYDNTSITSSFLYSSWQKIKLYTDRGNAPYTISSGTLDGYYYNGVLMTTASPYAVYVAPKGTRAYNVTNNFSYIKTTDESSSIGWAIVPELNPNTADPIFSFTRNYTNHAAAYADASLLTSSYYYINNDIYIKKTITDTIYSFPKMGINTTASLYKLDIDANTNSTGNPIRLQGLQAGAITDSILTSASGVVRRLSLAQVTQTSVLPQGSLTVGASPTTTIIVPITNGVTPLTTTDITHIELWYQAGGTGAKTMLVPTVDFTLTSISGSNVTMVVGSTPTAGDKFYILIK